MIQALLISLLLQGGPRATSYDGFGASLAFLQPSGEGVGRLVVASSEAIHGFGGEPFQATDTRRVEGGAVDLEGLGMDWDGDGLEDLVLGRATSPWGSWSRTVVVSGRTFEDLHSLEGRWTVKSGEQGPHGLPLLREPSPPAGAHWRALGELEAGDLDGDGVPDRIVVEETRELPRERRLVALGSAGPASLWESRSSQVLRPGESFDDDPAYGDHVCSWIDVDGDGVTELAVTARDAGFGSGAVYLLSGCTGDVLQRIQGDPVRDLRLGVALAVGPDLDGDGEGELFVGRGARQSGGAGRVDVFSSRSQAPIRLRIRTLRRPR